jgi:4'-phosphopantetheinyl transferase
MTGPRVLLRWARPLGLGSQTRAELARSLSGPEQGRFAGLHRADDRDRFVVGHLLLRVLVSELVGVPVASVVICAQCDTCGGPHGRPRPRLAGATRADPAIRLSLAHSGDRVLAAATLAGPVGVDVEPVAAQAFADWSGFDEVAFPAAGRAAVERLAAPLRPAARAALWVRQEAAFKAGLGASVPRAGAGDAPGGWDGPVDCGAGYAAWLVVRTTDGPQVSHREWSWRDWVEPSVRLTR